MKTQCKINHGIMPFWADMTLEEAKEIGFEVLETREVALDERNNN